jgi:hypothetical protein
MISSTHAYKHEWAGTRNSGRLGIALHWDYFAYSTPCWKIMTNFVTNLRPRPICCAGLASPASFRQIYLCCRSVYDMSLRAARAERSAVLAGTQSKRWRSNLPAPRCHCEPDPERSEGTAKQSHNNEEIASSDFDAMRLNHSSQ